jgi:hypothetical protein
MLSKYRFQLECWQSHGLQTYITLLLSLRIILPFLLSHHVHSLWDPYIWRWGHAVAYLVEALCQSGKVAGSSPDDVDFFSWPNPSSRTMALGSTQPLTGMSTRNLPGVKGGRRIRLTTLPPSVSRLSRENVGASTTHTQPSGPSRPDTGVALPYLTAICEVIV